MKDSFWAVKLDVGRPRRSPGHGPIHLLVDSAQDIGLQWDSEQAGWIRPGLPPLHMMTGTIQHFRSAIWQAWQNKVAADLCNRNVFPLTFTALINYLPWDQEDAQDMADDLPLHPNIWTDGSREPIPHLDVEVAGAEAFAHSTRCYFLIIIDGDMPKIWMAGLMVAPTSSLGLLVPCSLCRDWNIGELSWPYRHILESTWLLSQGYHRLCFTSWSSWISG